MKTAFIRSVTSPMLIGFAIVIVLMVSCSSANQTINPQDMGGYISSTPEAAITTSDGGNVSSESKIVTDVLKPGPSGERIETIATEEEVLSDLITFDRVYQNLGIKKITDIVDPNDGASTLYIATQNGIIYSVDRNETSADSEIYLDIQNLVSTQYNEEGLLGLAFDPDFRTTREFYVYYIAPSPRRSVVARYVDHGYGLDANEFSSEILLEIPQPFGNHNGGQILFGPDGFLYIGLGDGGGANDPHGHAQNLQTLLGSILRIDVRRQISGVPYGIPETNPFFDSPEYRSEIWAYGFRNPWRFAFDTESGKLWAADVGQERWEEVNKVVAGANFGWNVMEGAECLTNTPGCDTGKANPVWAYGREQGCSVIGGVVYEGSAVPQLAGMYLFGDYCTGTIWALKDSIGYFFIAELGQIDGNVTTFGSGEDGHVYIGTHNGEIYRLNAIP